MWQSLPQSAAVLRAGDLRLTYWLKPMPLTAQSQTDHTSRYWKPEIA